jgi:hypothetical protein
MIQYASKLMRHKIDFENDQQEEWVTVRLEFNIDLT